jgi:DNA-binding NtrC family response regulator
MALPSVLLVSSNPDCRQTLTDVLRLWGMEGSFVSTIAEARKMLLEQPITLVFCERNLADGGLTDLAEAAASKRSPVRLVAILHDVNDYAEAIQEGAFAAVLAPCQRPDVQWAIIQATLADRRAPQEFEGQRDPSEDSMQGLGLDG